MLDVQLYSVADCADCQAAKQLLQARGVVFTEIDLDSRPGLREKIQARAGGSTHLPYIFIGEHCVAGYAALQRLADNYQLNALLCEE